MTQAKPIVQAQDAEFYSPWGQFYADIYYKVSASNPIHYTPQVPPPNPAAHSAVQNPMQFPDDSVSQATPQTFIDQFRKGSELYHARQYAKAVECFHTADRLRPGDADCVVMLANCYQNMNHDSKAESIYKYATDLDPHHAIAWHNRGLVLQRLQRLQEAKECHLNAFRDRYIKGMPSLEGVVSSLATVLTKMGDQKSACRVLQEAVEVNGVRGPLTAQLADMYAEGGDPGNAIDILRRQEPEDVEQWFKVSTTSMSLNDRYRQTELLSRLMSPHSFRVIKNPEMQKGFHKAIAAAVAQIKSSGTETFSALELGGLGLYSMWALRLGCSAAACRVKCWSTLSDAIRQTFRDNGFADHQCQIQEYMPTPSGAEDPLAELPPQCKLVVQGINCMATVPLLLTRMAQFQSAGLVTVPQKATFRIVGIQCDQLHNQTNVGPVINGFDVSDFGDFCTAIRKYNLQVHLAYTKHILLTEEVTVPIKGEPGTLMQTKIELPVIAGGRLDAIATWYDFELGDGIAMSMGPSSAGLWKQNIQMVHLGHEVKPGDKVEMECVITKWSKDHAQMWIMFDKIGLTEAAFTRHDTALGSFDALGGAVWHFDMMSDFKRNDAYERALKAVVKPNSVVLDIGTGSGLLAMMAARAGAKHVYACEMNPDVAQKACTVIKANGFEDKITVFGVRSTALEIGQHLPSQVDVVVTETMGTDLLSEAMHLSLNDARERLLAPGAVMVPCRGRVLGQLVQITHTWQVDGFGKPAEGEMDLRALNKLLPNFWVMAQMKKMEYTPLSDVLTLVEADFSQPLAPKGILNRLDVPVTTDGALHAMFIWWDAVLGHDDQGDIIIETGPDSRYAYIDHSHWSQMMQVFSIDGIPVTAGQQVPLVVYTDNLLTLAQLRRDFHKGLI